MTQNVKQKFELFLMLVKNIMRSSRTKKLGKEKLSSYRANVNMKSCIYLKDVKKGLWFSIDEDGVVTSGIMRDEDVMKLIAYFVKGLLSKNPFPDIDSLIITDIDTMFRLKEGKLPYLDQTTGKTIEYKYTVLDARRMGHVSIYGEGSNVSLLKFANFLDEHPEIVKEMI